ncbi:hypothetical protein ACFX58_03450 [Sphingomonas sp. NCPPB 2930]
MKLVALWLIGLLFLAPHPSAVLWLWAALPLVALPLWAFNALVSPRR